MPFQKGQSGNPGGRPKAAAGLRECLGKKYGDDGRKLADKLDVLINHRNPKIALAAIELALAYLVGKPVSQHELSGVGGKPLAMRVVFGGRYRPDGTST